jgi:cation:H+ antiporter
MTVSTMSALKGEADVAFGNVVGSNTFNVLFILGLSALVAPLVVAQKLVRVDVPLMIGSSVALLLLGLDGRIGRIDGLLLFAGLVVWTVFTIRGSTGESREVEAEYAKEYGDGKARLGTAALLVLLGLVGLVLGSKWFVEAAVATARSLGVSELVIGLTIVAAGTSLPEVATSVLATFRGERDIAVGNVVGSNVFNVLGVMGVSAAIAPDGVPVARSAMEFDVPIMLGASLACLPIFFTGWTIARWEGFVFLGYYAAYVAFMVMDATRTEGVDTFGAAMMWFVVPLTVLTLAVVSFREIRRRRAAA